MLLLLFKIGDEIHAVDATSIVEVLPLVDIRMLNGAPRGVIGTFNYRGVFVPIIDLGEILVGRSFSPRMSTRLILAHYNVSGTTRLVGIVAENATETLRCDVADLVSPGIVTDAAPYLGSIVAGPNGLVQRIEVDKLVDAIMPGTLLTS